MDSALPYGLGFPAQMATPKNKVQKPKQKFKNQKRFSFESYYE
jgi:hypothetical protein